MYDEQSVAMAHPRFTHPHFAVVQFRLERRDARVVRHCRRLGRPMLQQPGAANPGSQQQDYRAKRNPLKPFFDPVWHKFLKRYHT
jgi:hypothetical protein